MTATAGLIGVVSWSVQGMGQLEQKRSQRQILETLLESGTTDQQPDHRLASRPFNPSSPSQSLLHSSPEAKPIGAPGNPIVRVALLSHSPPRAVNLKEPAECKLSNGAIIRKRTLEKLLSGNSSHLVTCKSGENGAVLVNNRNYPGTIYFLNRGNGWIAINQLPLERYVASVVGSEMPSHWNPEALKAQAVAARSYALVHLVRPADSDFNLGDTTRWQAYGGLNSQSRATNSATKATKGLVLSYQGGLVESLYASTSEIAAEAHSHLGASMSQHGAQNLAMKGLKFNEILSRYYVGASLSRLKTNEN